MKRQFTTVGVLAASLLLALAFVAILTLVQPPAPLIAKSLVANNSFKIADETSIFTVGPLRQGSFTSAGISRTFRIPILNNSTVPTDVYEIELSATWPVAVYGPDGTVPLTDTNGNGNLDTGVVHQGHTFDLLLEVGMPITAVAGFQNNVEITITSWINPSYTQTAFVQTAIPAAFVQAFRDHADDAMSLLIAEPTNSWLKKQTSDYYWGTGAAVAETPDGYIYTWSKSRLINFEWNTEVEYILTDKSGVATGPIVKLSDHSTTTRPVHDIKPVVDVTPEGFVGIAWHRQVFSETDVINHNIFMTSIDPSGNIIYGPTNITLNEGWVTPSSLGIPNFDSPSIAATGDERFFIAWHAAHKESGGDVSDIYFSIRERNGITVTDSINFTNDIPDETGFASPTVASVSPDRVVLAWVRRHPVDDDVYYAVLDSEGNTVKAIRNLSRNEQETDWLTLDATELSDGHILVAWKAWGCSQNEYAGRIKYAILGANYNRNGQPVCLGDPGIAAGGDWGVSVVADANANAIVTWTDEDQIERHHLYYALVDGKLDIVTEPMIFYRSETPPFSTSYEGYASTTRQFVDGSVHFGRNDYRPKIDEVAKVKVVYGNYGTLSSSPALLTATLDAGLSYQGDTASVIPLVNGNQVTWDLPSLVPGITQEFDLLLEMSESGEPGITYPLSITLEVAGNDISLDNNLAQTQVTFVEGILFVPIVTTDGN